MLLNFVLVATFLLFIMTVVMWVDSYLIERKMKKKTEQTTAESKERFLSIIKTIQNNEKDPTIRALLEEVYPDPDSYKVMDYVVEDRIEVSKIFEALVDACKEYGSVSVADYYDMIGHTSPAFTDHNYGWTLTAIQQIMVLPIRHGYQIKLPRPIKLNKGDKQI